MYARVLALSVPVCFCERHDLLIVTAMLPVFELVPPLLPARDAKAKLSSNAAFILVRALAVQVCTSGVFSTVSVTKRGDCCSAA